MRSAAGVSVCSHAQGAARRPRAASETDSCLALGVPFHGSYRYSQFIDLVLNICRSKVSPHIMPHIILITVAAANNQSKVGKEGIMFKQRLIVSSCLMLGLVGVASADISGTVAFTTPVVNVLSTDSIPVFVTLTMTGDALITDGSGNVTSLSLAQIQANQVGSPPPNAFTGDNLTTNTNETLYCSGTFFQGCGGAGNGGAYDFTFGTGPGSFFYAPNLDLEPGTSTTFLFGTFTPEGGNAPAGTYNLPEAQLEIEVFDTDVLDTNGFATEVAEISLGDTFDSAGFTANVTAANVTPEPGFFGIIALALPVLLFFAWRRSAARGNA